MPELSEFAELRYPFTTAREFFRDYLTDQAALHLVFGWIAAILLMVQIFVAHETWARKLLTLYFGLTLFNNFAFQILPGGSLGDLFGVLCAIYFCVSACILERTRPVSPVGMAICGVGVIFVLHAALIGAFYPELNAGDAEIQRFLVISKVFVLGINVCLFDQAFDNENELLWFIRGVVNFALIGILAYFIQAALLATGTLPYGTFFDAGYIGFPSFGGVSIERGHFGKFLTPLFPLFLYLLVRERRRKSFLLFVTVTLVNFSASSLSFFAVYVGMAAIAFRAKLSNVKTAGLFAFIAGVACVFIIYTWNLWTAVISKVYELAFQGGTGGGRDIGTFIDYLETYPFGISYGGSSLRVAPGLDEINAGIFAFITQMSFLSALFFAGFAVLVLHALFVTRDLVDSDMRKALAVGILAIPFIFATDVLWFVPTIWLPILLTYRLADIQRSMMAARHNYRDRPSISHEPHRSEGL